MTRTKIWPSPKLVVIGGGTGTSTILSGLKKYTDDITAIISVYDNGGSTGRLREDLNILATGDIRSCLVSLSDNEVLTNLLTYRFKEGGLDGHNFGNIFLAAMNQILGDFSLAIKETSKILNITGKVLPITLENANLIGILENGKKVRGESQIPLVSHDENSRIKKIYTDPYEINMVDSAKESILNADLVILGPGSLYTSIIPNLLAKDMVDTIYKSNAKVLYVSNIMGQIGETEGYSVKDHYQAIIDHSKHGLIDYIIVNEGKISKNIEEKYKESSSEKILLKKEEIDFFKRENVQIIKDNLVEVKDELVRHDAEKLAQIIFDKIL
ncbi:MAG: gluconeogenesis factor YvcK family protein [Anaerococcus sp.]